MILIISLNKIVCEKCSQNEFENIFQKFIQNKNLKKHFQTFSSQLQNTENVVVLISEFIFIQISTVNFQTLINCSYK